MNVLAARFVNAAQTRKYSRDLIALYSHRMLMRLAITATSMFGAVFLFQQFNNSLIAVALIYGGMYAFVVVGTPFSSRLLRSWGLKTLIMVAIPVLILSAVSLYAIALGYISALWGAALFAVAIALYRALYWVPYHVDLSLLLDKTTRGRQIATLTNISDLTIVVMPLIAGFTVAYFGFGLLFIGAIVFMALSIVPVMRLQNVYESYRWNFIETLRVLFDAKNRPLLLAYMGDGAQTVTLLVLWPLFVFVLLNEQYTMLGIVAALTLLAVLAIRHLTGKLFDTGNKQKILIWGAVISATGWMMKIFVGTPVQILMVDAYHGLGRTVNRTSVDAMAYEQAADNGRYIDEYTTLKEMAMNLGRVSLLILVGLAAWYFDTTIAFTIAIAFSAVASLATMFLTQRIALR